MSDGYYIGIGSVMSERGGLLLYYSQPFTKLFKSYLFLLLFIFYFFKFHYLASAFFNSSVSYLSLVHLSLW